MIRRASLALLLICPGFAQLTFEVASIKPADPDTPGSSIQMVPGGVVHKETKDQPIYALVVSKSGSKLKEAKEAGARQGLSTGRGRMAGPDGSNPRAPAPGGPTIFTALQEQLGLKLEAQKGPVPNIVIDRAEKPSEN